MSKSMHLISESLKVRLSNRKITSQRYVTPKRELFKISDDERVKVDPVFKAAQDGLKDCVLDVDISTREVLKVSAMALGHIEFDIDLQTRSMEKAVHESGIQHGIYKFLDTVF